MSENRWTLDCKGCGAVVTVTAAQGVVLACPQCGRDLVIPTIASTIEEAQEACADVHRRLIADRAKPAPEKYSYATEIEPGLFVANKSTSVFRSSVAPAEDIAALAWQMVANVCDNYSPVEEVEYDISPEPFAICSHCRASELAHTLRAALARVAGDTKS